MQKTVLVADDDPINRLVLCEMLDLAGFATIEAVDGADAVQAALRHGPAVILMDINMPRMTGIEALDRLRQADAALAARTLAVTADVTTANREACRKAGFAGVVLKPVDLDDLLASVRRLADAPGAA